MKSLVGKVRAAIDQYGMIKKDDVIAVGVSGGKDSLVLLYSLLKIQKFYPVNFTLVAISIDPGFQNSIIDFSSVTDFCHTNGIKHVIKRTSLFELIFNNRKEKNPCSLCSRMRRGIIHNLAVENGCNKVALGHNLDDAVETFFLNLLNGGRLKCFSPMSYLSRKDLWIIRPLIFCKEEEVLRECKKQNIKIIKSGCPVDGKTQRQKIKQLLQFLHTDYDDVKKKVIVSIVKADLDDWGKTNS